MRAWSIANRRRYVDRSTMGVMVADALLDALDRLRGTGPEFDSFLANHGPMAAEALVVLGHVDGLPTWVDAYRGRLAAAPEDRHELDERDWEPHLGEVRLVGDWTRLMRRQLA